MFLYSKEEWFTMAGSRLQEAQLSHYQRQDVTPLIGEVIDRLKEAKYFNILNLIEDRTMCKIKEGNKWKVAFLINKGLFEPQVIYFGLYNSFEMF